MTIKEINNHWNDKYLNKFSSQLDEIVRLSSHEIPMNSNKETIITPFPKDKEIKTIPQD